MLSDHELTEFLIGLYHNNFLLFLLRFCLDLDPEQ
jgi:hypothetical protein